MRGRSRYWIFRGRSFYYVNDQEVMGVNAVRLAAAAVLPATHVGSLLDNMQPHRGALILVLGILGLVLCGIFTLKEMDEGRMESSGRSMTNAGRICGMIVLFSPR